MGGKIKEHTHAGQPGPGAAGRAAASRPFAHRGPMSERSWAAGQAAASTGLPPKPLFLSLKKRDVTLSPFGYFYETEHSS